MIPWNYILWVLKLDKSRRAAFGTTLEGTIHIGFYRWCNLELCKSTNLNLKKASMKCVCVCVFACIGLYHTWCFLSFLGCVARSFPWILEVINCYLFTCLLHHSILSFLNFNYMNAARLDICPQLLDALFWFNVLGIFFSLLFVLEELFILMH